MRSVAFDSLWPHGLQPTRLLCPQNSPGKNTGVGSHFLLQGIFLTQELNPHLLHLLHWRWILTTESSDFKWHCFLNLIFQLFFASVQKYSLYSYIDLVSYKHHIFSYQLQLSVQSPQGFLYKLFANKRFYFSFQSVYLLLLLSPHCTGQNLDFNNEAIMTANILTFFLIFEGWRVLTLHIVRYNATQCYRLNCVPPKVKK